MTYRGLRPTLWRYDGTIIVVHDPGAFFAKPSVSRADSCHLAENPCWVCRLFRHDLAYFDQRAPLPRVRT